MRNQMIVRINPMGLQYTISDTGNGECRIRLHGGQKMIIVKADIDKISAAWYQWQMIGKKIQEAFANILSASEREFILTVITPTEWDEIFKEKE